MATDKEVVAPAAKAAEVKELTLKDYLYEQVNKKQTKFILMADVSSGGKVSYSIKPYGGGDARDFVA